MAGPTPTEPDPAFGRAVASRRAELGLSRKEVAARSGLSYPYLADIESGRKHPSAKALHALADALETRAADLLHRADTLSDAASDTGAPVFASEMPPGPGARPGWFKGDRLASLSGGPPGPRDGLRDLVREVVREELGINRADTPPPMLSAPAPASSPPAGPTTLNTLPGDIASHLPAWLTEPATTPTDMAIQAIVLEHLHHLDHDADARTVRAAIREALDDLATRARGLKRR